MRRTALTPLLALCVLATAGAGPDNTGPGEGLIRQGAGGDFVFEARDAPISAALEELATRHGIEVGAGHHVADRTISGRFVGSMPEILDRIFRRESFVLFFDDGADSGAGGIRRLVFAGRSDAVIAPALDSPDAAALPGGERKPMPERLYYEGLPPPPIPDVVAHAIAPPPPRTPEREAFDKALAQTAAELEKAVRPLRALRD